MPGISTVQKLPGPSSIPTAHASPAGPPPRTVTAKPCVALDPPGSLAVTVTVVVPAAAGARVTVLPETVAVTMAAGREPTAYVRGSPFGSLK